MSEQTGREKAKTKNKKQKQQTNKQTNYLLSASQALGEKSHDKFIFVQLNL